MHPKVSAIFAYIRTFFTSDSGLALLIAIGFQSILTLAGLIIFYNPEHSPLHHTMQWDAAWYMTIITDHYVTDAASPVFYPLFPLVMGILHFLTLGLLPYPVLGLLLNTVCLWLALFALVTIAKHFSVKLRWLSVLFLLTAPAAFFMNFFYTESLFMAIAFWAYAFALKRNWLVVGILLAILTACRLPAFLFVGLCGLEYLRSYNWSIKKSFNPTLFYFLLAPVGFITYGVYLWIIRGDFLTMFHAYDATNDWPYQQFNPNFIHTIARAANETVQSFIGNRPFDTDILINHTVPLVCIGTLFATSVYLLLRKNKDTLPLGIFGLVSIIFFTLNSNVVSVHRYTLPCLTIYIGLMLLCKRGILSYALCVFVAIPIFAIQILLLALYLSTGQFVG